MLAAERGGEEEIERMDMEMPNGNGLPYLHFTVLFFFSSEY